MNNYLFDTYALMEILDENPSYKEYTTLKPIINDFIFAEFCYNVFKDQAKNASELIDEIKPAIVHASPEWIEEAMKLRLSLGKREVSMTDCIGYIMAKKLGIKFLTGDKEFQNLEDVEFVK